jgi:hypothetical protein
VELKQSATGPDTIVDDAVEQCKCYIKESKATTGVVIVFPKRESGTLCFKWWTTIEEEEEEKRTKRKSKHLKLTIRGHFSKTFRILDEAISARDDFLSKTMR